MSGLKSICKKTKMCRFFTKDVCTQGDNCNFAHGEQELVLLPDLQQTKLCPQLKVSGRCLNPQCTFAHRHSELRVKCAGKGGVGDMNSGAATHKNSSTEQQKKQGQQQQLVYGAYYAVAGDAPTGQRMPSPSDSVDSGSHGSTTATSMNEPFKDIYLSEAIDKETMWDPVEDSPGQ